MSAPSSEHAAANQGNAGPLPDEGEAARPPALRAVDTALDVMLFLARAGHAVGVRELARQIGAPRSTMARIVMTLERRGFLRQSDQTLQYALGPRILEVSAGYSRTLDLRTLALPDMMALAKVTGESVFLGALDQTDVIILERVDGTNALRMMTEAGAREPLYCTGLGKILLAGLPERARERLIRTLALTRHTARTIRSRVALRRQVAAAARDGFAIDDGEYQDGARCIAVPIRDQGGAVIAALSVAGPAFRMGEPRVGEMTRQVVAAGRAISAKMGCAAEAGAR